MAKHGKDVIGMGKKLVAAILGIAAGCLLFKIFSPNKKTYLVVK